MYSNIVTHNPVEKRDELYLERIDGIPLFIQEKYLWKFCLFLDQKDFL